MWLLQDSNDQSTNSTTTTDPSSTGTTVPQPLNIPPSRARRQLAARLAQRKQAAEAAEITDPDAADPAALEVAHSLPEEPTELESLAPATETELREAGLHFRHDKGRFGGTFSSDDDSSDEELELGGKSPDESRFGRRPSTTEAKERRPLDDEEDTVDVGRNGSSDDDDDEQLVEIKPRRTSWWGACIMAIECLRASTHTLGRDLSSDRYLRYTMCFLHECVAGWTSKDLTQTGTDTSSRWEHHRW
jgi:hypothetical protein